MSEKKTDLMMRYETMLSSNVNCYFDADEFDEIAFQYELADKIQEAYDAVEHGLSLHPHNATLNVKKAKYLLALGRIEDSEQLVNALPLDSEEIFLVKIELCLVKTEKEKVFIVIEELINSSFLSLDICFDIIDMLLDYGYDSEINNFAQSVISRLPNGNELLRELGIIYEDKQEYDKAIEVYNQLLDLDPYSYIDWFNLAKINALKKDYSAAIEACDFALTAKENDESALSFKGYCYYDSEQYADAIEVFEELSKIVEDKSVAYELISECYSKLNQFQKSIDFLKLALEINTDSPNICYQLATSYYELGQNFEAENFLLKTIELDPNDADAYSFLGEIYMRMQNYDKAKIYYLKSLSIDPSNEETILLLGDNCCLMDEYDEAVKYYKKLFESDKFNVKLIFKLILAYYNAEQEDEAMLLMNYFEDLISRLNENEEISDENKIDLEKAKTAFEQLKDILRKNIDEIL